MGTFRLPSSPDHAFATQFPTPVPAAAVAAVPIPVLSALLQQRPGRTALALEAVVRRAAVWEEEQ